MNSYLIRVSVISLMCIAFLLCSKNGMAQSIGGFVLDERNTPVPYANIFVRELNTGTSTDGNGKYFMLIDPGTYNVVVSSIGYESTAALVVVRDEAMIKDFVLRTSNVQLDEIVVKASKKDPAYEIIQNAIKNKHKFLAQAQSYRTNVYVKATEVRNSKKSKKPLVEVQLDENDLGGSDEPKDPFDEQKKKDQALVNSLSMLEMQVVLNYKYPNLYKEERTAYKAYGQKDGLFVPLFSETDFNFYHNLVHLKGIAEVPLISPLSRTAILSYKYKLEEALMENGQLVYKIKVTPLKTGDATCRGYIYINDNIWNINRLELELHKGGLKFYDAFAIKQSYKHIEDSLWIPVRQEFTYFTKAGGKSFEGNTVLYYDNYQKDFVHPANYFGNEVSVITREAYKRDSSYWNNARPEPLTEDQQRLVTYRDSIDIVHNSKEYLDSVEAHFNKVRLGEILYHGVEFRKHEKKSNLFFSPALSLIDFAVIGGFRINPYVSYFRRYGSGRMLRTSGSMSYGLKNGDIQGNGTAWLRYDPFKLADVSVSAGRSFQSINRFDAYLNQLRISNYILHDYAKLTHRIEMFNGFYLYTDAGIHNRQSVDNFNRTSIINEVIAEDEPLVFEDYKAFISNLKLSYTPGQRYMTEPDRKIVLGSKYPTFSLAHRKGWNGLISSAVDFDYVEASVEQNLMLGTLGNSRYSVMAGTFVNTRDLRFIDIKRFRQSDPYLYSDPLHSFQSLDTALMTSKPFIEAHYIHHFNGAMINNIPFIKKTQIRTVAGGGVMWMMENNYRHQEVFGGIERVFKLGPRRRLRMGVFAVFSQSNQRRPTTDFKVSFDIIDTWKRDWSY